MTFQTAIDWILKTEGGYAEPPHIDQPTNMGITLPTLSEWWGEPATKDDLKALSIKEASDIYRAKYWDAIDGDSLPSGLALVTFDGAVNSGPVRSIKWLQAAVGVPCDGLVGHRTILAAKAVSQADAINDILSLRLDYLKSLPGWGKYGKGWFNRLTDLKIAAFAA